MLAFELDVEIDPRIGLEEPLATFRGHANVRPAHDDRDVRPSLAHATSKSGRQIIVPDVIAEAENVRRLGFQRGIQIMRQLEQIDRNGIAELVLGIGRDATDPVRKGVGIRNGATMSQIGEIDLDVAHQPHPRS